MSQAGLLKHQELPVIKESYTRQDFDTVARLLIEHPQQLSDAFAEEGSLTVPIALDADYRRIMAGVHGLVDPNLRLHFFVDGVKTRVKINSSDDVSVPANLESGALTQVYDMSEIVMSEKTGGLVFGFTQNANTPTPLYDHITNKDEVTRALLTKLHQKAQE